jgi:hypothetical protein|nr:MAG TPA: hypothetical protein [Caudoviricetes sp.]
MDGLDRLSDIIDTLLKDIDKHEQAQGTKDAINYFYNEKEKAIENLQSEINTKEAIIFILKDKIDNKDIVLEKYIKCFVDKEL